MVTSGQSMTRRRTVSVWPGQRDRAMNGLMMPRTTIAPPRIARGVGSTVTCRFVKVSFAQADHEPDIILRDDFAKQNTSAYSRAEVFLLRLIQNPSNEISNRFAIRHDADHRLPASRAEQCNPDRR